LGEIGENRAFEFHFEYLSNSVLEASKVNVTYLGLLGNSARIYANRCKSIGLPRESDAIRTRQEISIHARTNGRSFV